MVSLKIPYRKAFTLIELIFAIVIIGIVFLSLPSLSTTNSDAIETSTNQEALFAASAELSKIMTFRWDDNGIILVGGVLSSEQVVDTQNNADLNRTGGTSFRIGHINNLTDNHRQFHATPTPTSPTHNGDLLSRVTANRALFTAAASANKATGYKKNPTLSIAVDYFDDSITASPYLFTSSAAAGVSNMKMIQVFLDIPDSTGVTDGANDIILRSYAANIGEVELHKW